MGPLLRGWPTSSCVAESGPVGGGILYSTFLDHQTRERERANDAERLKTDPIVLECARAHVPSKDPGHEGWLEIAP